MGNIIYIIGGGLLVLVAMKIVHMVINLCYETESWEMALTSLLLLSPPPSPRSSSSHEKDEDSSSSTDARSRSCSKSSNSSDVDLDTILLKKIRRSSDENSHEITS